MRKHVLFLITAAVFAMFGGGAIALAFSTGAGLPSGAIFASSFIKRGANTLSMGLQREIWLPGLKDEYVRKPTWLDVAEDLSSFVDQAQVLHFAESGADPEVYVDAAGDIDSVEPSETPSTVELQTYDSQNYKIRQASLAALPYDKISHYTRKGAEAIRKKEALEAAYMFTPDAAGTKKIVIPTTGANDGNGLKMLQLSDIVTLATASDNFEFPEDGRNLVLTTDMWWQLVNNNEILKAQLQFQLNTGVIDPQVVSYYGWKIHKFNHKVGYNLAGAAPAKAVKGTAYGNDIVPLGFGFCKNEVFRASGQFLMTYLPFSQNTKGRAHEVGFQHRFKAGFQRAAQKYSAVIYQAKVEAQG